MPRSITHSKNIITPRPNASYHVTISRLEEKGNHVVSKSNLPNHRLLCSTRSFLPHLNLKEICYIYLLFADMFLEELKL